MQIHRSRRLCAVGGSGLGAAGSGDFAGPTRALGPLGQSDPNLRLGISARHRRFSLQP